MKKIIIINVAALLFASLAFAGPTVDCNASATSTSTGLTLYGGKNSGDAATAGAGQKMIGKTSTGVSIGIITSALGYAVVSQHKQGIKAYGSSHDSTAIYMADAVAGTTFLTKPSAIGSTDFVASGTKWSSM